MKNLLVMVAVVFAANFAQAFGVSMDTAFIPPTSPEKGAVNKYVKANLGLDNFLSSQMKRCDGYVIYVVSNQTTNTNVNSLFTVPTNSETFTGSDLTVTQYDGYDLSGWDLSVTADYQNLQDAIQCGSAN